MCSESNRSAVVLIGCLGEWDISSLREGSEKGNYQKKELTSMDEMDGTGYYTVCMSTYRNNNCTVNSYEKQDVSSL